MQQERSGKQARIRYFLRALAFTISGLSAVGQAPLSNGASAPATKTQDPYERTSPASTVLAFLQACRGRNYLAATRYLDLRKLTPEERRQEGPRLAQELGQALDNDPQFDLASLSHDPEGDTDDNLPANRERIATMHLSGRTLNIDLQRTEIRQGFFVWRFAPETIDIIPTLSQQTAASKIERFIPQPLVQNTFLDTPWWRWIALIVMALISVGIARLLSHLLLAIVHPLLHRFAPRVTPSSVDAFIGPVQLLLAAAIFRGTVAAIDPSAIMRLFLGRGLSALSITAVVWLLMRIVDLAMIPVRAALAAKRRTITHSVIPLAGRILKVIVIVFGVTAALASWGYDTRTVLAGLGIGGIAIALAAKATVENFFGGLAVVTDHPVYVGDFCKFGDSVGTVEDIGLRSTRIRTLDRTLLTVPNAQFSSVTVENFSRQDKMLFHLTLNLRRDTTPDQLREILSGVQRILEKHEKVETGGMPVRFVGVGTYSLDVEVFVYVLTDDGDQFMKIRQDLILRILDVVADAGTNLALPTQVLHQAEALHAPEDQRQLVNR